MRYRRGDTLEKFLVHWRVTAASRIRLVMQVLMSVSAVHDAGLVRVSIEAKHFSGLMIYPDKSMVVIRRMGVLLRLFIDLHFVLRRSQG